MIHAHLTAMALALVLFFVIITLQANGKNIKVLQMVLRTSYIFIFITGIMIFFTLYSITFMYILKAVAGLALIGVFEMIIGWKEKGKDVGPLWIVLGVAFLAVLLLGMMLPLGMDYLSQINGQ